MSPAQQIDAIPVQKLPQHLLAESEAEPSDVGLPVRSPFLGVAPQNIAEHPLRRNLLDGALESLQLLDVFEIGADAAVHAEDLPLDECAHRHKGKALRKLLP